VSHHRNAARAVRSLVVVAALWGAGPTSAQTRECEFPDPEWCGIDEPVDPLDFDFDPAGLQAAAAYADQIGSECLVVVRDGHVVHEWYKDSNLQRARNQRHDTWSVAKSFTALAAATAVSEGRIASFHQPVSDFVPEWAGDERQSVTIAQVLSGLSGLNTDKYPEEYGSFPPRWLAHNANLARDYAWVLFEGDQTGSAKRVKKDYEPGTKWKYNNRVIQVLHQVVLRATGQDPEAYLRDRLWSRLGMSPATSWKRDRSGNPTMYSSVNATCLDLARVGHLVLKNGRWGEEALIEPELFDEMLRREGHDQLDENPAYGYLFWLNERLSQGFYRGNNNERFDAAQPFDFAPRNLVSMQGVGQNFVDVVEDNRSVPGDGTVFVHVRKPALYNPFALMTDARRAEHRELLRRLFAADDRNRHRGLPVPMVTPTPGRIVDVGREARVEITASYPGDGTEEIRLAAENLPDGASFVMLRGGNPATGLLRWTPGSIGTAHVRLRAEYEGRSSAPETLDLLACARQGSTLDCGSEGILAAPVIPPIPFRIVPRSRPFVAGVGAVGNGPMFLSWDVPPGEPAVPDASFEQLSENPALGVFRWSPTRPGLYTVRFRATASSGAEAEPVMFRFLVTF